MKDRTRLFRSFMLVLGMVVIAAFAAQSRALAQNPTPCLCPNVYLKVDPLPCTVTICVRDFSGFNCYPIAPNGGLFPVPCNTAYAFYIRDCNGNHIFVDANTPANCLCIAPGCCVNVFVVQDINGCWVIKVEQAQTGTVLCPVC